MFHKTWINCSFFSFIYFTRKFERLQILEINLETDSKITDSGREMKDSSVEFLSFIETKEKKRSKL
jgi:hypothetical protein